MAQKPPKMIPWFTLSLDDGFEFCDRDPMDRVHANMKVTRAAGRDVFKRERDNLKCACCGLHANVWIGGVQGPKDKRPALNLFHSAPDGANTMFTQDHIIPKAFGGSDSLDNMRVMCSACNWSRGSKIDQTDLDFMEANPHLIEPERFITTIKKHLNGWERRPLSEMSSCVVRNKELILMLKRLSGKPNIESVLGSMNDAIVLVEVATCNIKQVMNATGTS